MGPVLEILSGDLSGRSYELDEDDFRIGRGTSCQLVIPKRYISREHAVIARRGAQWVLDGLSAKNPVRVGSRPAREHVLVDGDEFEMCGIRFKFHRQRAQALDPRHEGLRLAAGRDVDGSWADVASTGSGSGRHARPVDVRRSNKGAVVFEVDDDTGPEREEKTGSVPTLPTLGSRASGSGASGSGVRGESSNERTAELGVPRGALDPNDPDYDPFAEVDRRKRPERKVRDPQREALLRVASVLGLLGIGIAALLLYKFTRPPKWTTEAGPSITLAVGEVKELTQFWSMTDEPLGRRNVDPGGGEYVFFEDPIAQVEWAVPHIEAKTIFLVRGLQPGKTQFALRYPKTARIQVFTVEVAGTNPIDAWRDARRARLQELPERELDRLARSALSSGRTLEQEREVPGKETNYRQALLKFEEAKEAALTLKNKLAASGPVPAHVSKLVLDCETAAADADRAHEDFVRREFATYQTRWSQLPRDERIRQLKRVLRAINDDSELLFKRLKLLLVEGYRVPWDSDRSELWPYQTAEGGGQ